MRARVIWPDPIRELFLSLPDRDRELIEEKVNLLRNFPYMYPVNLKSRRFRRHRRFTTGNWMVYYRVVDECVYIRCIWPARTKSPGVLQSDLKRKSL